MDLRTNLHTRPVGVMPAARAAPAPLVVVHVLTSLCLGGAERMALVLAGEQVRRGHRVLVVSLEEPPGGALTGSFREAGIELRLVPKRSGYDPRLSVKLARVFSDVGADVVHTHNPLPLVYAAVAAKLVGARVVHTKHGPHPDYARRLWLRRLGAASVDAFVAVSEPTAAFARSIREVSRAKLHVVDNGIDLRAFRPDSARRASARSAWGLGEDVAVVGTVGRLAAVKNHFLLLEALAPLLNDRARLWIAGDGPLEANIAALAEELGVAPWVRLCGAVRDVPSWLCGLDVFALSSRVEGLPLAVLEAMACGLPVVATAVGGLPRVVQSGRSGLLARAGDTTALREALALLLASQPLRASMGKAGRALAERDFGAERMVRRYMDLYRSREEPT